MGKAQPNERGITLEKQGDRWNPEQRQLAIEAVAAQGSIRRAAQATGVPVTTIAGWLRDPIGKATAMRVSRELAAESRLAAGAIIRRAFELLSERIEQGDPFVVRIGTGAWQTIMLPVKAKDLAVIAAICAQKLEHLRAWEGGDSVAPSDVATLNRENVSDLRALLDEATRRLDARDRIGAGSYDAADAEASSVPGTKPAT